MSFLSSLFQLAPAQSLAVTAQNVTSITGVDDALFNLERKMEAYTNPTEGMEKKKSALDALKKKQANMYKALIEGADEGDAKIGELIPAGISVDEWKKMPFEKRQKLALAAIQAKSAIEMEMLDQYFPESFNKTSKKMLELKSLKKMMDA